MTNGSRSFLNALSPSSLRTALILLTAAIFLSACATRPGQGSKKFPERISDWSVVEQDGQFFAEARQWPGRLFPLYEGPDPQLINIRSSPTRDSVFILYYTAVPRPQAAEIRAMVINFLSRDLVHDDSYQYINAARNLPSPKWTFGGRTILIEHPGLRATEIVPY